jgi:hypothetical protein
MGHPKGELPICRPACAMHADRWSVLNMGNAPAIAVYLARLKYSQGGI